MDDAHNYPPPNDRDDRGHHPDHDRKRGRSPPQRDDRDSRRDDGRDRGGGRSPQRRRHDSGDDRYRGDRGGGHGRRPVRRLPTGRRGNRDRDDGEVLSFREFAIRHLGDDVGPAEAERRYEQYQSDHAEGFRRKNFAEYKGDPELAKKYDPRSLREPLKKRDDAVVEAAAAHHADLESGAIALPAPAGGGDGDDDAGGGGDDNMMMDAAAEDDGGAATAAPATADDPEKKDSRGRFPVPPEAWHPARLARDLRQAHRLVRALDAEKGVEANPLGQAAEDDDDALRAVLDAADPTDAAKTNKHAPTATTDEKKDADDAAAEDDAMGEAAPPADDADGGDGTGGVAADVLASLLDARIFYLWRAHGVDYYAAKELTVHEYLTAPPATRAGVDASCLTRPAKPSDEELERRAEEETRRDAEAARDRAEKVEKEKSSTPGGARRSHRGPAGFQSPARRWANRLDRWTRDRLTLGDPARKMLGEARLERELGEWMESCVVRHEENRFGCTLSAKLFVGVEYVIKHIKTKQTEHVEAQTEKILDQIYLENYLAGAREEDREAKRKGRAAAREAGREAAGGDRGGDRGAGDRGGRADDDRRGGDRGRGGGDRGRGGRNNSMLGGAQELQPGMMFMPVPGAGPLGPFVQVPVGSQQPGGETGGGAAAAAPPIPTGPMVMMAPGGSGGARAVGKKNYTDLDAPASTRVVLDYGDI